VVYQPTPPEPRRSPFTSGEVVCIAVIAVVVVMLAAYGTVILVERHNNQLRDRAALTRLMQTCNSTDFRTAYGAIIGGACPPGTRNYSSHP
jgi:hypothetical protein